VTDDAITNAIVKAFATGVSAEPREIEVFVVELNGRFAAVLIFHESAQLRAYGPDASEATRALYREVRTHMVKQADQLNQAIAMMPEIER